MTEHSNRFYAERQRYLDACHAMQTGVQLAMTRGVTNETEPKHLRVGVNAAMVEHGALLQLLIDKGVVTEDEFAEMLADKMEAEVHSYKRMLGLPPNVDLR